MAKNGAPHIALFPFPAQGHITPMLQLASLLHSKGFSTTIIHAEFNSPDRRFHPNFNFVSFADDIDPQQVQQAGIMDKMLIILAKCEEPFRSLMGSLQSDQNPVECLLFDANLLFCGAVAEELKLPSVVFRSSSPTSFMHFIAFPYLQRMGYLPVDCEEWETKETIMEGMPPFRVKDLPRVKAADFGTCYKYATQMVETSKQASALVFNSFNELDRQALYRIQSEMPIHIYFVGPLCIHSPVNIQTSLIQEDRTCLTWLDRQTHGSVIYVSIGSVANMDPNDMAQMAQGIRDSQQPFLWVVRPGSVQLDDLNRLLSWFEEATKDRGLVVKWAPQTEVLAQPAVGGFMTHCGWNSTLESICAGKPMLCWPSFGDQMGATRLVSHVWRIGIDMAGKLQSEKIKENIGILMGDQEEGKEMRERAKVLREIARKSIEVGGSSYEAVNRLADQISSFVSRSCDP